MNIVVNNTPESVSSSQKLYDLLLRHELSEKQGIAVAVNNAIVPKADWGTKELFENDKVTILLATQGG
jgi:sulfur carrier protein